MSKQTKNNPQKKSSIPARIKAWWKHTKTDSFIVHWLRARHFPTHQDLRSLFLSFIVAFGAWFYIAARISTSMTLAVSDVSVSISNLENTRADSYGLKVMEEETGTLKVSATIYGARTTIGSVGASDIEAYVDFNSVVDQVGKQRLPILLRSKDGTALTKYEVTPATMDVMLDRFQTVHVPVEVDYSKLKLTDGALVDIENLVCEPSNVSVTGPTKMLAKIDHVTVNLTDEETILETKSFSDCSNFVLMDADNNIISDKSSRIQGITNFFVTVPVYYTTTLPLTLDLDAGKNGFDTEWLMQHLRLNGEYCLAGYGSNTLNVTIKTTDYAKKQLLDTRKSHSAGVVSPEELNIDGSPVTRSIQLIDGYEFLSVPEKIYVTLDSADLISVEKTINIPTSIINGSPDFNYVLHSSGYTIHLIGSREQIEALDLTQIKASVNLLNANITEEGTYMQKVYFTLPESATRVWISGNTQIPINASKIDSDT